MLLVIPDALQQEISQCVKELTDEHEKLDTDARKQLQDLEDAAAIKMSIRFVWIIMLVVFVTHYAVIMHSIARGGLPV